MLDQIYGVFVEYLRERFLIRQRRLEGYPGPPFTNDPILAMYKFTNVKRDWDRTTQWLVKNWYNPNNGQPLDVQAMNCAIARYFGRIEFLEELGYQKEWRPQYILEVAKARMKRKESVFTGAYIITNQGMTDPKEEIVVNYFLQPYREALPRLLDIAVDTNSWQMVSNGMKGLPGMGPFMTKEILLDWQLTNVLPHPVDRLTWTPAGPGAIRGLNRLAGDDINKGMTQEAALARMKYLLAQLAAEEWPAGFPEPGRDFGVTDVQFSLCELDKYLRVHNGEGRPRSKFRPTADLVDKVLP
jgi:hypothetical protein